ncbi:MAG: hypothetical protein ABJG88_09870 [Litorimonas sp.]
MTRRHIFLLSTIVIGGLWPAFPPNVQASELNLYAGPQSITPHGVIHVSVQSAAPKIAVELSYNSDEGYKVRTGMTERGLISFEVPAQKTIGQMRFTAKAGEHVSNSAIVSVFAGPPQDFSLNIERAKSVGSVNISSDVIRDAFENYISSLALVSLDWTDDNGLKASQSVQLTQGRIALETKCPEKFDGALTLRARVNSASSMSSNLSSLCREEQHLETK